MFECFDQERHPEHKQAQPFSIGTVWISHICVKVVLAIVTIPLVNRE